MEIILGILLCISIYYIITLVINNKDYEYWHDKVYIPFNFDEITKPKKYFKFVYGDNYEEGFYFYKWKKAGKKRTERNYINESRKAKEFDEINKK